MQVDQVKKQLDAIPKRVAEAEEAIKDYEPLAAEIEKAEPLEIQLKTLEERQIKEAETVVEEARREKEAAVARVNTSLTLLKDQKTKLDEVTVLKKAATEVGRLNRETKDLEKEVQNLEMQLKASGGAQTTAEVSAQIKALGEDIREHQNAVSAMRTEYRKQEATLNAKKLAVANGTVDLQRKEAECARREELEKQRESLHDEIARLERQLRQTNEEIAAGIGPLRKLQDELAQYEDDMQASLAELTRQRERVQDSVNQLESNEREIKGLEAQRLEDALASARQEVERRARVVSDKKAVIAKLHADMVAAGQLVARADAELRNLQDNIRLRQAKRELEVLEAELEKLDVEQAKRAHRQFEVEYNKQRQRATELSARQSNIGGMIETMKRERAKRQEQLRTDYKDIDDKYLQELVKVKTAESASDDVEKWRKALDQAIMNFHGLKMAEINETIAELWVKTYQGSDIDTISIEADSEGKSQGQRSYNYRVVMVKDQVKMDMRGRCSAGQKVLASIIIRLALAQSFALQCGILALDEPTTNLDRDNVHALAEALSGLVKARAGQTNFQLLVITHDESFLNILGSESVISRYSRVFRIAADGKIASRIERKTLHQ